ncbi:hypothetical protein GCM10011379_17210 [Filimonas zeae]|uniref:Uncharacterized protein n=1 Tax=Filimonas zeae TaxID=1737353 RepID=A0A917IVW5_9BACT|nr:hypothetical protein GCM10011379_17210 [Filimonas zeae]
MGKRQITIKESAAESIAAIAFFIESHGLIATAEKFTDAIYDYLIQIADSRKRYAICREPGRALIGYKCISYKKKYTIVLLESDTEVLICEFQLSKNIHW